MDTKERAKELIEKYKPYVYCFSGSGMLVNQEDEHVIFINAKGCALVAVDEIINTLNNDIRDIDVVGNVLLDLIKYWVEVKQEIINL